MPPLRVYMQRGEITFDLMQNEIEDGGFWIKVNEFKLEHLDLEVRKNLKTNKSIRRGFVNIFQIATECLKARKVPTAENLNWCCNNRREWPPDTKNYLRRAGTQMGFRAVLRYMFDAAKEEDEKADRIIYMSGLAASLRRLAWVVEQQGRKNVDGRPSVTCTWRGRQLAVLRSYDQYLTTVSVGSI
ncbi:hypothetical protein CNMCM7691_008104 [Aspergillus felis]|uniref:Uncharacterized protein n=1 Tax=Aspergillus felis TaxID=1287682 RepID=A0A8H6V546_9EURO|nr:hypothetical protein CNMCM7691_008104 [Aspergillus felis]